MPLSSPLLRLLLDCLRHGRTGTTSRHLRGSSTGSEIYAREGVGHVWLIDPLARTLEILRLDGGTFRIVGAWNGEAIVHAEPFEVLGIALGELWTV